MPTLANALAIMAKAPVAGAVKTRLVPPLTPAEAAELYRALLLDQFDHFRNFPGANRYVFYAPADGENLLRELGGTDYVYLAQSAGDLGVRMQQVFTDLRLLGHRNIVLIGSDLPALPWAILDQAFEQLAGAAARVVLGPSRDGGYYLLGMNRPTPEIFAHMSWSHERVLTDTTTRLDAVSRSYSLLPTWFDIDVAADFQQLWTLVKTESAPMPRRTMDYLEKLGFGPMSKL
ncbi:MAG TPA: TIGR04282 family arsenosugar biosynthesis glycosyltransferase [Candidatus Binatia bacterium]|nr:TIGR04282 family arsenosugar biosynthesis glycosyltransferase [Candidatus Binatia bacterium]